MQICDLSVLLSASTRRWRNMLGTAGTATAQSALRVELSWDCVIWTGDVLHPQTIRSHWIKSGCYTDYYLSCKEENTDVLIRTIFLGCLQVVRALLQQILSPMADFCSPNCHICFSHFTSHFLTSMCIKWSSVLGLLHLHVQLQLLSKRLCFLLRVKQAADSRGTLSLSDVISSRTSRGKK